MECFFSKLLSHFQTLGFVKHFVYLCYVAVHGTDTITRSLQLTAKVHMYYVVVYIIPIIQVRESMDFLMNPSRV